MYKRFKFFVCLYVSCYALFICLFEEAHAKSTDWGYENTIQESIPGPSQSVQSDTAPKAQKTTKSKADTVHSSDTIYSGTPRNTRSHMPNTHQVGPFARGNTSSTSLTAINNWLELLELISAEKLREDQHTRYRQLLLNDLMDKGNDNAQKPDTKKLFGILSFWPKVKTRLEQYPEQKELFTALFKALIRLQARCHKLDKEMSQITNEVLGPERIAVPGDPALTEEAIDAYNDMACFLYEQKHPNKTIDASDNRTIMAAMICDRFKDAPNAAAKMSMVNFALTWAKFKISWANSSDDERQRLLSSFDQSGSPQGAAITDPVVEVVLKSVPWNSLLYKAPLQNKSKS